MQQAPRHRVIALKKIEVRVEDPCEMLPFRIEIEVVRAESVDLSPPRRDCPHVWTADDAVIWLNLVPNLAQACGSRQARQSPPDVGIKTGLSKIRDDLRKSGLQNRVHAVVPHAVALDIDESNATTWPDDSGHFGDGVYRLGLILEEEPCPGVIIGVVALAA